MLSIKNPVFRYIRDNHTVYYISKKNNCFGKCEYFTVPVTLQQQHVNCLVGYTNKTSAETTLSKLTEKNAEVLDTSCKDLAYISGILKVPLVVLMDTETDTIFLKNVN
ncbi:hypothetical protein EB118_11705 [bacterium]|nr:hypothetical protein [bacterium]NDC94905.1 hypothetical protein [bacterium]NDD84643.1 hypothetical protein [bacterium]NDG30724.1 hypothetical protein [bacterium]